MISRLIPGIALSSVLFGQTLDSRERGWREDIDSFVDGISAKGTSFDLARGSSSRGQKDFDKLYPAATFQPAIAALKETIPSLSDAGIVLRLMEIVASAVVGHNSVELPKGMGFERRIPLTIGWLSDGPAVTYGTAEFKDAIGRRIRTIGGKTPDELLHAVTPLVSHENDASLRNGAAAFLTMYPVLSRLGLIGADGLVTVVLERPDLGPLEVKLPLGESKESKIGIWDARGVSRPLFLAQINKKYWSRYLEDSQTEFIQYNRCQNDAAMPFGEFTRAVMKEIDGHPVKRVAVDLRWNPGGDSRVIAPLRSAFESRRELAGKIYVLIGTGTFSSAMLNAVEWKERLKVTLVGEPTGGKPASYGEVKKLTLPNSKVVVRYSSKYFPAPRGMDTPSVMPDFQAPLALADLLSGRDPALKAILAAR